MNFSIAQAIRNSLPSSFTYTTTTTGFNLTSKKLTIQITNTKNNLTAYAYGEGNTLLTIRKLGNQNNPINHTTNAITNLINTYTKK